ncbi:hypothetical protein MnBA_40960 [Marinobacterium sp. BA1]
MVSTIIIRGMALAIAPCLLAVALSVASGTVGISYGASVNTQPILCRAKQLE